MVGDLDLANPWSGSLIYNMGTNIQQELTLSTAEQIRLVHKWGSVSTSERVRQ